MNKWVFLAITTVLLLLVGHFFKSELNLHVAYTTMVAFFAVQTFVLFRMDQWVSKEWAVQLSLIKVGIRLLSSMAFILVLMLNQEDRSVLVVQFIILYLIYMIFEIGSALTNLRQN